MSQPMSFIQNINYLARNIHLLERGEELLTPAAVRALSQALDAPLGAIVEDIKKGVSDRGSRKLDINTADNYTRDSSSVEYSAISITGSDPSFVVRHEFVPSHKPRDILNAVRGAIEAYNVAAEAQETALISDYNTELVLSTCEEGGHGWLVRITDASGDDSLLSWSLLTNVELHVAENSLTNAVAPSIDCFWHKTTSSFLLSTSAVELLSQAVRRTTQQAHEALMSARASAQSAAESETSRQASESAASEAEQSAQAARSVMAVDGIADLLALPAEQRKANLRYLVKEYHAGTGVGGGMFCWSASSTKTDDGGTALAAHGVATGRWIRIIDGPVTPHMFGERGDGTGDSNPTFKKMLESETITDIFVPNGTYNIVPSSIIYVKSNKHLKFDEGARVVVNATTGKWVAWLRADLSGGSFENVTLDGVNFDANIENNIGGQSKDNTDNQQYFVHFLLGDVTSRNIRVSNSRLKVSSRNTIVVNGRQASGVYIQNNVIEYRLKQTETWDDNSVLYINAQNYFITGNHIYTAIGEENGEGGIEAHWGPGVVSGNIVERFQAMMHLTSRSYNNENDARYSINCFGNTAIDCHTGITIWSFSPDIAELWTLENVHVTDNILDVANIGIQLRYTLGFPDDTRGNFRNITITNNRISYKEGVFAPPETVGHLNAAICLGALGEVSGAIIEGNSIINHPYGGIAVPSYGFKKSVTIKDNKFVNPCGGSDAVAPPDKKNCVFFSEDVDVTLIGNQISEVSNVGYSYATPSNYTGEVLAGDNQVPHNLRCLIRGELSPPWVRNKYNPHYLYDNYASTAGNVSGFFRRGDIVLIGSTELYVCTVYGQSGPRHDITGSVTVDSGGSTTYSGCEEIAIGSHVQLSTGTKTTAVNNKQGQEILDGGIVAGLPAGTYSITNVAPVFKRLALT